jgi:hypothetical protein
MITAITPPNKKLTAQATISMGFLHLWQLF